jgi:hypothetical protein
MEHQVVSLQQRDWGKWPYEPQDEATGYWLVARYVKRTNVLVVEVPGGERLLPVFSAAAKAEVFVQLSALDRSLGKEWFARRTGRGELLSMLIGPRRSVRRVALDPSPELMGVDGVEQEIELVCVTRKDFVERLLVERHRRPRRPGTSTWGRVTVAVTRRNP